MGRMDGCKTGFKGCFQQIKNLEQRPIALMHIFLYLFFILIGLVTPKVIFRIKTPSQLSMTANLKDIFWGFNLLSKF